MGPHCGDAIAESPLASATAHDGCLGKLSGWRWGSQVRQVRPGKHMWRSFPGAREAAGPAPPTAARRQLTLAPRMAASPGTEVVTPASPPPQPSHLKAYPYLFVRETDQVKLRPKCTPLTRPLRRTTFALYAKSPSRRRNCSRTCLRATPQKTFR